MGKMNWKVGTEIVGILAVVGSLLFVGLQLKQSQDIALSELRLSLLSAEVELSGSISDHADVWRKGLAGEGLEKTEEVLFKTLFQNYAGLAWTEQWQYEQFEQYGAQRVSVSLFAQFLDANPGARKVWTDETAEMYEKLRQQVPGFRDPFRDMTLGFLETMDQSTD